ALQRFSHGNLYAQQPGGQNRSSGRKRERKGQGPMKHSALRAIARKEFIQIRRDKATIYMVFVFPLMMLVLYGFGIRYDVKFVPVTVLDRDSSEKSRQYVERFENSPYFKVKRYVSSY